VGFYHDSGRQPQEENPPGCLDALLITRAVFGVLIWPMLAILLVVLDVGVIVYVYTLHPALALIPVAITAAAVWLFSRWEQQRFRPPEL
jgi:hypothetical protein